MTEKRFIPIFDGSDKRVVGAKDNGNVGDQDRAIRDFDGPFTEKMKKLEDDKGNKIHPDGIIK